MIEGRFQCVAARPLADLPTVGSHAPSADPILAAAAAW